MSEYICKCLTTITITELTDGSQSAPFEVPEGCLQKCDTFQLAKLHGPGSSTAVLESDGYRKLRLT